MGTSSSVMICDITQGNLLSSMLPLYTPHEYHKEGFSNCTDIAIFLGIIEQSFQSRRRGGGGGGGGGGRMP